MWSQVHLTLETHSMLSLLRPEMTRDWSLEMFIYYLPGMRNSGTWLAQTGDNASSRHCSLAGRYASREVIMPFPPSLFLYIESIPTVASPSSPHQESLKTCCEQGGVEEACPRWSHLIYNITWNIWSLRVFFFHLKMRKLRCISHIILEITTHFTYLFYFTHDFLVYLLYGRQF